LKAIRRDFSASTAYLDQVLEAWSSTTPFQAPVTYSGTFIRQHFAMDKEIAIEKARPTSKTSSHDNGVTPQEPNDPKWEPGFGKRFPWIGLGALAMVLVCAVGSVIILVTSDHISQTKWPQWYAPNILINVMVGLENICFLVAICKTAIG
jgi:hypothetical protein